MFIKTSTTNETTWAALKAAVDNGTIAQGDLIVFNLKNGEEVAVRATQDKNGKWFFVLEDCLADEHCMLEQLKVIFRNRALVDRIRAGKLVRLSDRITGEARE